MHSYFRQVGINIIYKRISLTCISLMSFLFFYFSLTIISFAVIARIFFFAVTGCFTEILYLHLVVKLHLLRVISDVIFSAEIVKKGILFLELPIYAIFCHALLTKYCKFCHLLIGLQNIQNQCDLQR